MAGEAGGAVAGDFSADHGDLIAPVQARTVDAVFVDFVGKILALGYVEAEAAEEFRSSGEKADAADLVTLGLREDGFDKEASATGFLVFRLDGDGADFGEVRAVEVESAATNDFGEAVVILAFEDDEIADIFADFRKGARE
jgi:hypothetical protein